MTTKVNYTTEGGKKSSREFPTQAEAKEWIAMAKERGWKASVSKAKEAEEE